MKKTPYTKKELYTNNEQRIFSDEATEVGFLLGGIGTGNISIGSRGQFKDWEIFNTSAKGTNLPYSFFSIWAKENGKDPIARVLESERKPPYTRSHGFDMLEAAGLPRLKSAQLEGKYPFVKVAFEDEKFPVKVDLEAFTPFIPLNPDDSGIPGAIVRYKVKNDSENPVDVSIVGSLANGVGFDGFSKYHNPKLISENKNEYRDKKKLKGLFYTAPELPNDHLLAGSMSLMTTNRVTTYKTNWLEGGWFDGIVDFWDDFIEDGKLEKKSVFNSPGNQIRKQSTKIGSIGSYHTLKPGEEHVYEFILSWYFPNRKKGWEDDSCTCSSSDNSCNADSSKNEIGKNYYSTLYDNAWEVGEYLYENLEKLENDSRKFQNSLFTSTLPGYILEAIASNITVLRSNTCFRVQDGTFFGWEGCFDQGGCCPGSCTHVWNYAQTLAFLFPTLEQSMRKVEFSTEVDQKGKMNFRAINYFDEKWSNPTFDNLPEAVDGQMGSVVRFYREWKLSGNDKFLKELWPAVSLSLDFAFEYWDLDNDYVLDSKQHTTYDIEFHGINPLTNSMFFAALKAGREIAEYLGDKEHQNKYEKAFKLGSKKMDELLWNEEYYIQEIEDVNKYRYQIGKGCLADQVLGQFLSHVSGLGYILPKDHIKKTLESIFDYNFVTNFSEHHNTQRTYALNDEMGLVLCSWPKGERPKLPMVYADEVWAGTEYQVAANLIYEGFIDEGLTIVKSTRDRYDGYKRNPWDEVECGHHYVRSMSSWALLTALSGYNYDLVEGKMSFNPVINKENFRTFWSNGKAWGIYEQKVNSEGKLESDIEVLYGNIDGIEIKNN